jgi:transposase InsO family protein
MAKKVIPMAGKAMVAVVAAAGRGEVNVSAVCREVGCSRQAFYEWVHRYRAEGLDGFQERSRRPRSSPNQIPGDVEDEIVRLRKSLSDDGLDHGATTIQWHLGRDPLWRDRVPSVAGVHRVLFRRGLVVAQPGKRPRSSWCRFEAAAPNERWQIDATEWMTEIGKVAIFNIIDDHSRLAVASRAVRHATGEEAWTTFSVGAQQWGLPSQVLSDNGLCFSGKLRGFEVLFEARLRDAGIHPITTRPYHPQTTGKVERFQQTLKKWLRRQPMARYLPEFQSQLDAFCHRYNVERPHQGIGRITPITRWQAGPARPPLPQPLPHPSLPLRRSEAIVTNNGIVPVSPKLVIHIGVEWEGQPATVLVDGHHAHVFIDHHLVRVVELDPTRSYYGSGRPRGGPRRPRLQS